MVIETEALATMIYIFIALAIGLAVFDQYRKLKAEFSSEVKKANEQQTENESVRPGPIQKGNCAFCGCDVYICNNCKRYSKCSTCREYHD
jgi:uncharacterized membrane-anchored protein YitT (DUF2179 family)